MEEKRGVTAYCDFDGTVTTCDVFDFVLERLAEPQWKDVEERWLKGEIGSRECMALQTGLIRGGWKAVEELLGEVRIDPEFPGFVKWCRSEAIPVVIVSDAADRIINTLLAREGIIVDAVYANHLVELPNERLALEFPFTPLEANCRRGLCKCGILNGGMRIVVGDGLSDTCWAREAHLLFAKQSLLEYCKEQKIPHHKFSDFKDILRAVQALMEQRAGHGVPEIRETSPGRTFLCR